MRKVILLILAISCLQTWGETKTKKMMIATTKNSKISAEKIWIEGNPNNWKHPQKEASVTRGGVTRVSCVNDPTLTYYAPKEVASDKAVVVCPGGGYSILAIDKEGEEIAKWLSKNGVHAFLLKYRLPRKGLDKIRHQAALQDAQRAISMVNAKSTKLGIKKVGIMGFSAGGHLSAVTACQCNKRSYDAKDKIDKCSCRPDFVGLIYPAYLVHKKSNKLANELKIPKNMPPVFLMQTGDDPIRVENSIFFYKYLNDKKISAEIHIFPKGPHGYGMRLDDNKAAADWTTLFLKWLKRI